MGSTHLAVRCRQHSLSKRSSSPRTKTDKAKGTSTVECRLITTQIMPPSSKHPALRSNRRYPTRPARPPCLSSPPLGGKELADGGRRPPLRLSCHLRHDRLDMRGRTVNRAKASIGFIKDKIEIRAGQNDGFNAVTSLEAAREVAQLIFVVG